MRIILRMAARAAAGPTPSVQKELEMKDPWAACMVASLPITAPMGCPLAVDLANTAISG